MSKREDIVAQAEAMIGIVAWSSGHQQIIDDYNSIVPLPQGFKMDCTQPWCATFVSVMAKRADVTDFPFECSCPRMVSLFANKGQWVENDAYVPSPGDIIFYNWDDDGTGDCVGTPDHVGIVWSCNGESMDIIEGNISSKVGTRFIPCNSQYIRGYGIPSYGESTTVVVTETPASESTSTSGGNTYVVKSGDSPWRIAQELWGDGRRYTELYTLNNWDKNHVIHPGDVILTSAESTPSESSTEQELKDYLESQVKMLGGIVIWQI